MHPSSSHHYPRCTNHPQHHRRFLDFFSFSFFFFFLDTLSYPHVVDPCPPCCPQCVSIATLRLSSLTYIPTFLSALGLFFFMTRRCSRPFLVTGQSLSPSTRIYPEDGHTLGATPVRTASTFPTRYTRSSPPPPPLPLPLPMVI